MAFVEPASIRHRNSGAMGLGGPNSSARKFGASEETRLNDGFGNTIATFPTMVQGAAAQFDLLASRYTGLTVRDALKRWSGWQKVDDPVQQAWHDKRLADYCKVVTSRTGLSETDTLTAQYIRTAKTGIKFAKAMAYHEAGKEYPMSDAEWAKAHDLAFGGEKFVIPAADGLSNELGDRIADLAVTYVGKGEKPGPGNYQFMDDLYATLGLPSMEDNNTAWCKLLATALRKKCGAIVEAPNDPDILMARNFLKQGIQVDPKKPELIRRGDALVWSRGNSGWQGHTGTVVTVDTEGRRIECVEGNVGDSTVRKWYSFDQIRAKAIGVSRPVPDKRQPDGTVRYRDVIAESPSLKMQVYAYVAATVGGVISWWNEITSAVGGIVSALPFMAEQTSTTVGAARQITETAGLSMPAKLMLAMTFVLFATATYRILRERSKNGGNKVEAPK